MDLEFTDDQEELRQSVRAFLAKECPLELVRRVVETGEPADELWAAMGALDWPALALPEDCGGIGLSFVEVAVVVEELGAHLAPGPYLSTVTQYAPVVRETGDADQRRRLLGPVADGSGTGALALADHPRRWRPQDVTTTARSDGGGWILTGTKESVLAEPGVDEVAVVARVGGPDEIGVFVVPASALETSVVRGLDASRSLQRVRLDQVAVPGDRVLGRPGEPATLAALARGLEEATVALALETVGACQSLFDLTVAYAKDRHQFGVAIGSFQAIKHKLANDYIALQRARSLAYYAVAAIAEDDPARPVAAAMAKAAADDCQRQVVQDAIQTFGGIGFTWEHDGHLFAKRAKTDGALLGSATEHRLAVARALKVAAG